jgi:anthranilate phosphoribosyltransferase
MIGDNITRNGVDYLTLAVGFVMAACGVKIIQHINPFQNNKPIKDDLSSLGINLISNDADIKSILNETNIVLVEDRAHASFTRNFSSLFNELKINNCLQLIPSLANIPANNHMIIGVSLQYQTESFAKMLKLLGYKDSWVINNHSRQNNLVISGPSYVSALKDGNISSFILNPENFGLETCSIGDLENINNNYSCAKLSGLLAGKKDNLSEMVILNAASYLAMIGRFNNFIESKGFVVEIIQSGKALKVLKKLVEVTNKKIINKEFVN